MEDVICSECYEVNLYNNNYCSACSKPLKGICATCGNEDNITFLKAKVCATRVLKERSDRSDRLRNLIDSISLHYFAMIVASFILATLVGSIAVYLLPNNLEMVGALIIGGVTLFTLFYFVFSWKLRRIYSFRHTLISNFESSNPIHAELLKKVGWRIL